MVLGALESKMFLAWTVGAATAAFLSRVFFSWLLTLSASKMSNKMGSFFLTFLAGSGAGLMAAALVVFNAGLPALTSSEYDLGGRSNEACWASRSIEAGT